MYYILETLFLVGVGIILCSALWFLFNLFRTKKLLYPILLGLVGVVVVLSPVMYTRMVSTIDLGERERIVDGELHLTLTGWDRKGYDLLATKPDIVVLQMANPDVTDATLLFLKGQGKLRELDLSGSQVTDKGLVPLAELKALHTLRLRGTKISDGGLKQLFAALPNLQRLNVQDTEISSTVLDAWKAEKPGRRVQK